MEKHRIYGDLQESIGFFCVGVVDGRIHKCEECDYKAFCTRRLEAINLAESVKFGSIKLEDFTGGIRYYEVILPAVAFKGGKNGFHCRREGEDVQSCDGCALELKCPFLERELDRFLRANQVQSA